MLGPKLFRHLNKLADSLVWRVRETEERADRVYFYLPFLSCRSLFSLNYRTRMQGSKIKCTYTANCRAS